MGHLDTLSDYIMDATGGNVIDVMDLYISPAFEALVQNEPDRSAIDVIARNLSVFRYDDTDQSFMERLHLAAFVRAVGMVERKAPDYREKTPDQIALEPRIRQCVESGDFSSAAALARMSRQNRRERTYMLLCRLQKECCPTSINEYVM